MNWFKRRKRKKEINKRMVAITKELDTISMYLFDNPNIDFKIYNKKREPLFTEWFRLQEELEQL